MGNEKKFEVNGLVCGPDKNGIVRVSRIRTVEPFDSGTLGSGTESAIGSWTRLKVVYADDTTETILATEKMSTISLEDAKRLAREAEKLSQEQ